VADFLGLGTLADDEPGMDPEILKQLYRRARNDDGKRILFEKDPTFAKGWINLDSPSAAEIIAVFVPLDDVDDLKRARRMAQANLEAQPWNDVLGIDSPPIKCVVKIHGSKWGMRFQSAEPKLRGQEKLNEQLPPIPGDPQITRAVCPVDSSPGRPVQEVPQSRPSQATATEVLRKGGLPA
jgi:hypothetical protein